MAYQTEPNFLVCYAKHFLHKPRFLSHILSFNKYLLIVYCVPDTSPDIGDNTSDQNEIPALKKLTFMVLL